MDLQLSNVINLSVSTPGAGVGSYNPANLALFTGETPGAGFGTAGYKIYVDPTSVATDFGTSSNTYQMALAAFAQSPNFLANRGYLVVIPKNASEKIGDAITRTAGLIPYFGILDASISSLADMTAAANTVQALNKMYFVVSRTAADIDPGGLLDSVRTAGNYKTRTLFYGGATDLSALQMAAAYAGRALAVVFAGSQTTQTMHLKDLASIPVDPSMTQTLLTKALTAGADTYPSLQGVAKVFCSGANDFFDNVQNLLWFIGEIQVAGFNALAQVSTKIYQTEGGMSVMKGAYRRVCEQARTNGFLAPGSWTAPQTFGPGTDLVDNVSNSGYYIYSNPVASQSAVDRSNRIAPPIQIAAKYAGAQHSGSIIINVNK